MTSLSEPEFRLRVAREFLEVALRMSDRGVLALAALGLVLAVENAVLSVISCFKPPSKVGDLVMELRSVVEDLGGELAGEAPLLGELVEVAQYVMYTYRDLLTYGDPASGRTPSELLQPVDFEDLASKAARIVEVSEALIAKLLRSA